MSDDILGSLDFTDLDVCIECIKGKQTKSKKLGAYRTSDVLELIHTDICGPFPTATLLAMKSDQGVLSFMIPVQGQFFRRALLHSLRMLSLGGEIQ